MAMEKLTYKVLVKTDILGRVVEINSDAFVVNDGTWIEVDSGIGDRYHHAQRNYLPTPIVDSFGVLQYKLVDGLIVERTSEEKAKDYAALGDGMPTLDERVSSLEKEVMKL